MTKRTNVGVITGFASISSEEKNFSHYSLPFSLAYVRRPFSFYAVAYFFSFHCSFLLSCHSNAQLTSKHNITSHKQSHNGFMVDEHFSETKEWNPFHSLFFCSYCLFRAFLNPLKNHSRFKNLRNSAKDVLYVILCKWNFNLEQILKTRTLIPIVRNFHEIYLQGQDFN